MQLRRSVLLSLLMTAFVAPWSGALAQQRKSGKPEAPGSEALLRGTVAEFEKVWNRHDVTAWLAMMTDDIWFTAAEDLYGQMKGKKAVKTTFEYDVKNTDLRWEIQRLRMMPDGTASVVLRHTALLLPKVDGKYKREDVSEPSLSRWRLVNGKWRLFYFTSHKGLALAEMKKDGLE